MAQRITIRNEADMIAVVPVLLGFKPSKSLVMMTFNSFHARVDLPDLAHIDDCIEALLEPAKRHHVPQVAFLIYDDGLHLPLEGLLIKRFMDAGIKVLAGLQVKSDAFRRFDSIDWMPLDISTHPLRLDAHYSDRLLSREEMADYVKPVGAERTPEAVEAVEMVEDVGLPAVVKLLSREHAAGILPTWISAFRGSQPGSDEAQDLALVVGFCAWLKGDGAMAWVAVDQTSGPLAEMLRMLLEQAVSPESWDEFRDG